MRSTFINCLPKVNLHYVFVLQKKGAENKKKTEKTEEKEDKTKKK